MKLMKIQSALVAMLLTACMQQEPMVSLTQHNQLQSQYNQLASRVAQMEQQQQNLRGQITEVSKSRLVPTGVALPVQTDDPYEKAYNLYQLGKTDEALPLFERYLGEQPSGEKALLARYFVGDIYYMRHNYDYAARYFGDFLQQAPQHKRATPAFEKLIHSLEAVGRSEDAQILREQGVSALQR